MSTQQISDDMARQTERAGDRRLNSILRTLTVAVALLTFGFSAPMVVADHMGNHERGPAESTDCGQESSDVDNTSSAVVSATQIAAENRHRQQGIVESSSTDAATQTQLAVQDGNVSTGLASEDADDEEEPVPPRPFDGRPW